MRFDILTLFPEAVEPMLTASILGRAQKKGLLTIETHQIRDYTANRQNQVDDYPYGGGRGAILQCDPLYNCWTAVCDEVAAPVHTIFLSPCGPVFTQEKAKQLRRDYENIILVCGHYEGVDERFLDECVDEELSAGDFVLTGGEIPAMMVCDAVSRLVPGVLGDDVCFTEESHWSGLLEYPQYSRPESWHGRAVPEVLLSGDHEKVARWRKKQSLIRTLQRRPDLFYKLTFPYHSRAERRFIDELEAESDEFKNRDPKNLDRGKR
jgi:tRNA (guanine37-N1)-methyltransferase